MGFFWKLVVSLVGLTAFINPSFANPIYYETVALGSDRFEYHYTVDNQTGSVIDEFTVWFDLGLYDNLEITGSPDGWDGLEAQPDPWLPDDGFADWLGFGDVLDSGETLDGFSVSWRL